MNFDFDWGKHTPYVAGAFILTAVILIWMIGDTLLRNRHWRDKLKAAERDGQ